MIEWTDKDANDVDLVNRCTRWLTNNIVEQWYKGTLTADVLNSKIKTFADTVNKTIDWEQLTEEVCNKLGFIKWSSLHGFDLWLIPVYLVPSIPAGIKLYDTGWECISYSPFTASKETLYGCCKYGIVIPSNSSCILEDGCLDL